MSVSTRLRGLAAGLLALVAVAPIRSATPLTEIRVSPDTTATLGVATVDDEDVAADNLAGTVSVVAIGAVPAETELDGYALRPNGAQLISFDTTVVLPGGVTARPGDVWRYDGVVYAPEFEAAPIGVPVTANLDALALYGSSLLLSFDVALDMNGVHFDPEDLAQFDGTTFSMFFDGSEAGISAGLGLDAADYLPCNGHLLLSFDGSGSVGGVAFDDDDVLEFDRAASWEMAYNGAAQDADWDTADLGVVQATVNLGPGPAVVFGQTVTADANKATFKWSAVVSYRAVRGSFGTSAAIGSYAVNLTILGTANTVTDATVPTAGTGFWYLIKGGGCTQTSWQSALGLEPGRDASIP